jgi:hypothetical protein
MMAPLRALARYKTHGGYVWAAVMNDGELVCTPCVRENYRQIFASTKNSARDGWQCVGITNSGEWESPETCAHCYQELGT